jgi:hypothetical protein
MDEVDRRAGQLGDGHRALGGDHFRDHGPTLREGAPPGLASLDQPSGGEPNRRGVFAVQQAQHAAGAGPRDRLDVAIQVLVEPGLRQEHLDAGTPVVRQPRDVLEGPLIGNPEHRMEKDVGDRLRPRRGGIPLERLARRFARRAEGHVADRGDAARQRRRGARRKVVDPGGPGRLARRTGQVDVRVHPAGQDQLAASIDVDGGLHLAAELDDPLAEDADVHRVTLRQGAAAKRQVQPWHALPAEYR